MGEVRRQRAGRRRRWWRPRPRGCGGQLLSSELLEVAPHRGRGDAEQLAASVADSRLWIDSASRSILQRLDWSITSPVTGTTCVGHPEVEMRGECGARM